MYFLKNKSQHTPINIGDILSTAGASAKIYNLKDSDDLVFKEYLEKQEAKDHKHKLEYFI